MHELILHYLDNTLLTRSIFASQVDNEDMDGDGSTEDCKPSSAKVFKSVPLDEFKNSTTINDLPDDIDLASVFPNSIYFKNAELGESVMHQMSARDKVNVKQMKREYRCAHYRSCSCDAKLCIMISGSNVDYILTGNHISN